METSGRYLSTTKTTATDMTDRSDDYGLTAPQRQALLLAVEHGYYDVPRNGTLTDIAGELDISEQAASQRLRRGTRSLLRSTIQ
jgi:predicted DNA binding protein